MESNPLIILAIVLTTSLTTVLISLILLARKKSYTKMDKIFKNYIKAKQVLKEKELHPKITIQKAQQSVDNFLEYKRKIMK